MPTPERDAVIACCSFCFKANTEVEALVAGPAVFVCDECVDLCSRMVGERLARSDAPPRRGPHLRPWEQTESLEAALATLPNMARAQAQVEESLLGWVRRSRTLGATWAQIGASLGITRQSAWERFVAGE